MAHRSWTTDEYPAGCSKRPSSKAAASEEAKTPLADFFSILLIVRE